MKERSEVRECICGACRKEGRKRCCVEVWIWYEGKEGGAREWVWLWVELKMEGSRAIIWLRYVNSKGVAVDYSKGGRIKR